MASAEMTYPTLGTNDGELQGRRIALIGGDGFIGHNLALALVGRGAEVNVIDSLHVNNLLAFASARESAYRAQYLSMLNARLQLLRSAGVALQVLDARDYHALTRLLSELKPQVVVHLAAIAHAGRSNKDPFSTFDHSLRTLENALDWSREQVEHFVFLSSSSVYGNFQTESVDEDHPLEPFGIYGAVKLASEKIVIAYNQVFDVPYTIVRPSAVYGPRCVSRRVCQLFIENALSGQPLRIEGDGEDRLDFTYIDDLIEGLCLVLEKPRARNEIFNLTYGSARSVLELAAVVQAHFPKATAENEERDNLTPVRGTLSIARARERLGYEPRIPLEAGMARYIEWYRSFVPRA